MRKLVLGYFIIFVVSLFFLSGNGFFCLFSFRVQRLRFHDAIFWWGVISFYHYYYVGHNEPFDQKMSSYILFKDRNFFLLFLYSLLSFGIHIIHILVSSLCLLSLVFYS